MATAVGQGATGDPFIDGLLIGTRWNGGFTYSFPQAVADYQAGNGETATFSPVSFQQREATRAIMNGQTSGGTGNVMLATNVNSFVSVVVGESGGIGFGLNGSGDIRLGTSSSANPTAYAYYPNNNANGNGGDVWFGTSYDYTNPIAGNYSYHTVIHELGHSMGLKHSHELGGVSGVAVPSSRDAIEFTVMSYRSFVGGPTSGYTYGAVDAPTTFMMYDIQALQTMYGAYYGSNSGNTTYSWSSTTGATFINGVSQGTPAGNRVFMTVWDGGGIDTYDMSNYTNGSTIDLTPGSWSVTDQGQRAYLGFDGTNNRYANGTVYNSLLFGGNLASIIENAIGGSGNDSITGNQVNNTLIGNAGDDDLFGLDGNDNLQGGDGNDELKGGGGADSLFGQNNDDVLKGGGGADALDGGAGIDTADYGLAGGGVSVSLATGTGSFDDAAGDTLTGIENLTGSNFGDSLYGDGGNNVLNGQDGGDYLEGGIGSDTLNGGDDNDYLRGGFGTDTVNGGNGDDIIEVLESEFIDNVDGGAGTDTLYLFDIDGSGGGGGPSGPVVIDYTLGTWDQNPTFGGPATIVNIEQIYGTQFGDTITGGPFGDVISFLDGQGGDDLLVGDQGVDTINGGDGNDTLRGGFFTDFVNGGNGDDTIVVLEGEFIDNVTGGAGIDTLDVSDIDGTGGSGPVNINYAAGTWDETPSFGGPATIATIERIIGTQLGDTITSANFGDRLLFVDGQGGNDTIVGDDFTDTLNGGNGNDILQGGFNNDVINGGFGNDTVIVLEGEFIDDVDGGNGNSDTLDLTDMDGTGGPGGVSGAAIVDLGAGTWDLTSGSGGARSIVNVEWVRGTQLGDTMTAGAANHRLYGAGGNDTLIGGVGGGVRLTGELGDDLYILEAGNIVTEVAGEGTDTAQTDFTYTLANNVENLQLLGVGNINGTGNGTNNTLTGNTGNNILNVFGGLADTVIGGLGDDTFRVDTTDAIVENFGEGEDTVRATSSYTLLIGNNVERIILEGVANVSATGNELDNRITGNDGNNTITGFTGRDTLFGLLGTDRFNYDALNESGTTGATRDQLSDFDAGTNVTSVDRIDVISIDANDLLGGNQAFVFGGTATGQINVTQSGANVLISFYTDADAAAEMVLQANGELVANFNAGDFFL